MRYLLYNTLTTLACPAGAAWLALSARHRLLLGRFAPQIPVFSSPPLWVHACSVGEVGVAKPILAAAGRRWPGTALLLTTSTTAGYALAQTSCADVPVAWCPFDQSAVVRSFLRHVRPKALILIETEIWPNMLRETHRLRIPSLIVNGRISDKHYRRYLRFRGFYREVLGHLSCAGVQNEEYAERLARLGMDSARIRVTGATKFDGVKTAVPEEDLQRLRTECGLEAEAPLVVFGSTRPGDEVLAAECWAALRDEFPSLKLVVAPRHANRIEEAQAPFKEPVLRRSAIKGGREPRGERVLFLDTVGELTSFYALGTVSVVGGSFYAGVNGHNPLEPAALGIPTVFGPFMRNFVDPAQVLVESGGAMQVGAPDELPGVLRSLLADAETRQAMGHRGREAIARNQGAIERNLDLAETVLSCGEH